MDKMNDHRKKKHEEIEPEIESVKEGTLEQRSEKIEGEEYDKKIRRVWRECEKRNEG